MARPQPFKAVTEVLDELVAERERALARFRGFKIPDKFVKALEAILVAFSEEKFTEGQCIGKLAAELRGLRTLQRAFFRNSESFMRSKFEGITLELDVDLQNRIVNLIEEIRVAALGSDFDLDQAAEIYAAALAEIEAAPAEQVRREAARERKRRAAEEARLAQLREQRDRLEAERAATKQAQAVARRRERQEARKQQAAAFLQEFTAHRKPSAEAENESVN